MSTIQDFPGVQIVGVTQSPTRNGGMRYVVALSNGMQPSTFEVGVATKAQRLAGQPVTVRLEEKPSTKPGQRPFINILDVAPQGQVVGGDVPASFGAPAQANDFGQPAAFGQAAFGQAPAAAPAFQQAQFPQAGEEKETRIIRGNSLNASSALHAGLYTGAAEAIDPTELLGKVLQFASAFEHYIRTGKNIAAAAIETLATQAGVTPEQVAQAANAAMPGAVVLGAEAPAEAVVEEAPAEAPVEASSIPWNP